MQTLAIIALALIGDHLLRDPYRWRFATFVSAYATRCAAVINHCLPSAPKLADGVTLLLILLPIIVLTLLLQLTLSTHWAMTLFAAVLLYSSFALRRLREQVAVIGAALATGDWPRARHALAYWASANTKTWEPPEIIAFSCQAILRQGHSGVLGMLFWFVLAGLPGAWAYGTLMLLSALPRTHAQQWHVAARLAYWLDYIPARLTALTYTLVGRHSKQAWHCWCTQTHYWQNKNIGSVITAGAGALNGSLDALDESVKPPACHLGGNERLQWDALYAALGLVYRALGFWLLLIVGVVWWAG